MLFDIYGTSGSNTFSSSLEKNNLNLLHFNIRESLFFGSI